MLCKNRFFGIRTARSTLPAKQSVRSWTTFNPSFLKVFIFGLKLSGKFSGVREFSLASTSVARLGLVWKSQSEFNVWISAMLYITVSFVTFLLSILSRFLFGVESPENGPHISCKKNTFEHNYFTDFLFIQWFIFPHYISINQLEANSTSMSFISFEIGRSSPWVVDIKEQLNAINKDDFITFMTTKTIFCF